MTSKDGVKSDAVSAIDATNGEVSPDGSKPVGGPYSIEFPPDAYVWVEARKLVADKNIRVEDLATCCGQDPAIVMELLKVSNAMFFSGGRSPITSTRTAIVRLGSDVVLECLTRVNDRGAIDVEEVSHWFEVHRSRCKRTAIVARLLAETVAKQLSDDCQAAGLLMNVGDMLAVAHFREEYVRLADEHSRSGVNFRLLQHKRFDVEKMGLTYLRRQGIPENILFAIDREAHSRNAERAVMKPLCLSAGEMVDAFDANRWEKLAPGKTIPPKSAIRTLQLTDAQYLKVYERASEYLFSVRLLEEKRRRDGIPSTDEVMAMADEAAAGVGSPPSDKSAELQDEISNLLRGATEEADEAIDAVSEIAPIEERPQTETQVKSIPASLEAFSITSGSVAQRREPRKETTAPIVQPPKLHSKKGNAIVNSISSMFENASTSEELLSELLRMLVDSGPFEKSALIVVSRDRKHAIVVAARGPNIGNGQRLSLDDPLSPLAQCFSKVRSFGSRENQCSPWGSRSFALAPIDADHDTPVALYADCGDGGAITFEGRRVFRTVVEILNQKLPSIPGGIPVELEEAK